MEFVVSRKAKPGDRVAIVSPSLAAPAIGPAVHEQAMRRLRSELGLHPVEYPTTRRFGASPKDRAADLNAAFADPSIRAVIATIGGDDQIEVIPHLDAELIRKNPKPFLGYSDNTNLLNFLWSLGIPGFYGGSTQVQLGAGPEIDRIHLRSLRAALIGGGQLELTNPSESEDYGHDWADPRALTSFGERDRSEPWVWAGPKKSVEGRTWGGCFEVLDQLAWADRLPPNATLCGGILILEASEQLTPAETVKRWVRGAGERGLLAGTVGVMVARPPASALNQSRPPARERAELRRAHLQTVIEEVRKYNPDTVICAGVPFGHTRPQWIVPYGGLVHLDGFSQTVTANYD